MEIEYLESTCRICLEETDDYVELIDVIKSGVFKGKSYHEIFFAFSGYETGVRESEPKVLCMGCASELIKAHKFKEKCTNTQTKLDQRYESEIWISDIKLDPVEIEVLPTTTTEPDEILSIPHTSTNTQPIKVIKRAINDIEKFQIQECPNKCPEKFFPQFLDDHLEHCINRNPEIKTNTICKILPSNGHIRKHLPDVMIVNKFTCDICGVQSTNHSGITRHIHRYHLNNKHTCKYCKAEFISEQAMTTHQRKTHPQHKPPLKCKFCDLTTHNYTIMRNHKLTHSVTGIFYTCKQCGKQFSTRQNLKHHMISHTDARPFACEVCGSTYKSRNNLNTHKKTHEDKDYECPVCKQMFGLTQFLRNHLKSKHPEYEPPEKGTVLSKKYRIKLAEEKLRKEARQNGLDRQIVERIKLNEPPSFEEFTVTKKYW